MRYLISKLIICTLPLLFFHTFAIADFDIEVRAPLKPQTVLALKILAFAQQPSPAQIRFALFELKQSFKNLDLSEIEEFAAKYVQILKELEQPGTTRIPADLRVYRSLTQSATAHLPISEVFHLAIEWLEGNRITPDWVSQILTPTVFAFYKRHPDFGKKNVIFLSTATKERIFYGLTRQIHEQSSFEERADALSALGSADKFLHLESLTAHFVKAQLKGPYRNTNRRLTGRMIDRAVYVLQYHLDSEEFLIDAWNGVDVDPQIHQDVRVAIARMASFSTSNPRLQHIWKLAWNDSNPSVQAAIQENYKQTYELREIIAGRHPGVTEVCSALAAIPQFLQD